MDYSYGLPGAFLCSTTEVNPSDISSLEEASRQPLLQRQRCKKNQPKARGTRVLAAFGTAGHSGKGCLQLSCRERGKNKAAIHKRKKKRKKKKGQKETAHSKIFDDAMHEHEHCLYSVYFKT